VRRCAGFLTDDRRINVALTRARHQLICIGNARGTLSQSGAMTLKSLVDDAEARNCVSDQKMHSQALRKRPQQFVNNKEAQLPFPKEAAVETSNMEESQSGATTSKSLELDTEARNCVSEQKMHAEALRKRPQESVNDKETQLSVQKETAVETPGTEASQSDATTLKSLEVDAEARNGVPGNNLHAVAVRKRPQESINNKEAQLNVQKEAAIVTSGTKETDDQQQLMGRERAVTVGIVQTKKRRLESLGRYRWNKERTLMFNVKSNKYEYRLKEKPQH